MIAVYQQYDYSWSILFINKLAPLCKYSLLITCPFRADILISLNTVVRQQTCFKTFWNPLCISLEILQIIIMKTFTFLWISAALMFTFQNNIKKQKNKKVPQILYEYKSGNKKYKCFTFIEVKSKCFDWIWRIICLFSFSFRNFN